MFGGVFYRSPALPHIISLFCIIARWTGGPNVLPAAGYPSQMDRRRASRSHSAVRSRCPSTGCERAAYSFGLRASFRPSPRKLYASTTIVSTAPGTRISHGRVRQNV